MNFCSRHCHAHRNGPHICMAYYGSKEHGTTSVQAQHTTHNAHTHTVTHTSCIRSTMLTGPTSRATNSPTCKWPRSPPVQAYLTTSAAGPAPCPHFPPTITECCGCSDTSRSCWKTGSSINDHSHCRESSYKYSHTNRSINNISRDPTPHNTSNMQHTHKELPAFCVQQTVPTANLARTGTVCIDTECNDLQHRDARLVEWGRGASGTKQGGWHVSTY